MVPAGMGRLRQALVMSMSVAREARAKYTGAMKHAVGIYKIIIQRPEKPPSFYIGQTCAMKERSVQHMRHLRAGRHDNSRMQRSFEKYGEGAFSFAPVLMCERSMLTEYEQAVLDHHIATFGERSVVNVMRQCVRSHLGVKRTDETRRKMSAAQTGLKKSAQALENMSKAMTGKRRTPDECRKISEAHKATPRHPNSLAALAAGQKGEKRLARLREALVGKPKVHSDETKAKIAASLTGRKQSPELIERRIRAMRGRKLTPEQIFAHVEGRRRAKAAREALACLAQP